jgi:hypothetical protein
VTAPLRPIADPFVAAVPAAARVRTRLRVSAEDEAVLLAAGRHLGSLAGRDLTVRVREGRLGARGKDGHAAAVVIGRRALGHRARRRAGVTGAGQRTSVRRAAPRAPVARRTDRNGRPRQAQRQPPRWRKTATARRPPPPDQAAQDRSGPPAEQCSLPLSD